MTNYRRNRVAGATYFFTVNLADRKQQLLTDHISQLRSAFRLVFDSHPFTTDAIVILPDHLHAIWTLPPDDFDYSVRWRLVKSAFSRALPVGEAVSSSRSIKGERGIWQRRFWEHTIQNEIDFARHVDYIHFNPVKHSHVKQAVDWPYSSFHKYVKVGILPADWAGAGESAHVDFGEMDAND